jgi:hypothetical protein
LVDYPPAHVDVLGHRNPRMAQLVGDRASAETLLVEQRCHGFAGGVRHDPGERCASPHDAVIPLDVARVTVSAQRVREHAPADSGSRARRSRRMPTSQSGRRSTRRPDLVLGLFISKPWPFTRISVASTWTRCRSRSTCGQVRAKASPIRQPVPSKNRTRSGRSAAWAYVLSSKIASQARHSSSVRARASRVEGLSRAWTSRTGLYLSASRQTANPHTPDAIDRQSFATE